MLSLLVVLEFLSAQISFVFPGRKAQIPEGYQSSPNCLAEQGELARLATAARASVSEWDEADQ